MRYDKIMWFDKIWAVLIVLVVVLVIAMAFARGVLVSEDVAIRALETQGYTNIKIIDHSWFALGLRGGSEDDAARFTATATNPIGKTVEVEVYTGWIFKSATIRTR